jgi:hypothetical protein
LLTDPNGAKITLYFGWFSAPALRGKESQSLKTTGRGGTRRFDGHKRVKRRKRHLLVDTLGMVAARRVEAANVSDRCVGVRLSLISTQS